MSRMLRSFEVSTSSSDSLSNHSDNSSLIETKKNFNVQPIFVPETSPTKQKAQLSPFHLNSPILLSSETSDRDALQDPIVYLSSQDSQQSDTSDFESALVRLRETFGSTKPLSILRKALIQSQGDVHEAIRAAVLMDATNPSMDEFVHQPMKKRKLIKKKDLPTIQPVYLPSETIESFEPPKPKLKTPKITILSSDSEDESPNDTTDDEQAYIDEEEIEKDMETLKFFNSFDCDKLYEITDCAQEQANQIIELRPFNSMKDLRQKLSANRKKLYSVLDRYEETMQGYAQVDELISKCKLYGEALNETLKHWNIFADKESGEFSMLQVPEESKHALISFFYKQPEFVNPKFQLKSYQLMGISWLNLLWEQGLCGILADEMGLGKTAQVIVFLGHLHSKGVQGPHLIVCPTSTLDNWSREIETWCPQLQLRVYHGSQNERLEQQDDILENLQDVNVILTTYNMATGGKDDRRFLRKLELTSLILDEGHMIKNMESARYKYLSRYNAPFRLLMTGTPLQNNLMELLSLLTFIMPDLFGSDTNAFSKIFGIRASASKGVQSFLCRQRIQRAKEMMTPFVLRRRKDQVVKELPKKVVSIHRCQPTEYQAQVYQSILLESKKNYRESKDKISSKKKPKNRLSNVLMQLRKAANHPLLMRFHYDDAMLKKMAKMIMREPEYCDANQDYIFEDMQFLSDFELHALCSRFKSIKQFQLNESHWMNSGKVEALKLLLPEMKDRGDRILLFSQFVMMLDILEKVLETLGIKFLRLDGQTQIHERQERIDQFYEDETYTVFLISTKAGGVGINLTAANVVILYDMDFNPHNDAQAEDRAHRVGQTRDVTVLKFITTNTVEESILKCATTKIKLDQRMLKDDNEEEDNPMYEENVMELLLNEMNES